MNSPSTKLVDLEQSIQSGPMRSLYRLIRYPVEKGLAVDRLNQKNHEFLQERETRFANDNFFDAALKKLEIKYEVSEKDLGRIPREGPIVCVANHPYGGVDGLIMGSILTSAREDTRLLVNYLLGAFKELRSWTIEVNPFQTRKATAMNLGPMRATLKWLKEGHCLGTFPAGVVSHYHFDKRVVTDPEWNPNSGIIVQRSGATIVPMYFEGRNTTLFQILGLIHPRLRTIMLPRQMLNKEGMTLKVRIGKPISPQRAARFDSPAALTQFMRASSYILDEQKEEANQSNSTDRKIADIKAKQEPIAKRQPIENLLQDIHNLPEEALLFKKGSYSIYGASADQIPHILEEIGRTREETFRPVDEGTGKPLDIDRFDKIYHHLFMWDEESREIAGAYRYCFVDKVLESHGVKGLYCNTLYDFKSELLAALNPAIEVGRSYVTPKYQKKSASLALIWRGIGELVSRNPEYKTLFGAVSMTDSYRSLSKSLMVEYLKNHKLHPTLKNLISARVKPRLSKIKRFANIAFRSALPELDDVSSLVSEVEKDNKGVPILLKHYLKLNGVILCFGIDQAFSDALDGFIVVDLLKTEGRYLRKYMGNQGYEKFLAHHSKKDSQHPVAV